MPETYLYMLRLEPPVHAAAEKLIEVLYNKGKIRKGVKGKVSKASLLRYLLLCGIDMYKEEIFPKETNQIETSQPEIETEAQ